QNQASGVAAIEIIVESDRPISLLTNQIEKLWDITAVHVSTLNRA
ncbi:MAG: acetolactate synthase 2 small subunit, partial [Gammaproteobacteria bacterium]|nr:acetolactate synthase 2 small subunit [Gammaproteobacteria bacterium]